MAGLPPGTSQAELPAGLSALASLVGRLAAAEAQCPAADGSTAVYLEADGLPQNFSSANLACKFVPWQSVQDFNLTGGEVPSPSILLCQGSANKLIPAAVQADSTMCMRVLAAGFERSRMVFRWPWMMMLIQPHQLSCPISRLSCPLMAHPPSSSRWDKHASVESLIGALFLWRKLWLEMSCWLFTHAVLTALHCLAPSRSQHHGIWQLMCQGPYRPIRCGRDS